MALNLVRTDVYAQLEAAHAEIRELRARLEAQPQPLADSPDDGYIPAKVFADRHGISVSTVNRGLRDGDIKGKREADGYHWKVLADQPYHAKRNRG